jgi:hypothetical protein
MAIDTDTRGLAGAPRPLGRAAVAMGKPLSRAHPRFLRNPGNGRLDAFPAELVPTSHAIGLGAADPSVPVLSAAGQAAAETPAKAAAHA